MGQQNIDTINIYDNKKNKHIEIPSELQGYDNDNKLAIKCRDIIFNKQYGIFYYEFSSKKEAEQIIRKFEEHITHLRHKYKLPQLRWDITFNDIKTDKTYNVDWVWVMFPNGKSGYRLEYIDDESLFPEDLGTLVVDDGKLKIVQW